MNEISGKTILKQDIFLGAVITAFGAAAFWSTLSFPENSILFPRLTTALISFLGLLLMAKSALDLRARRYPEGTPVSLLRMKYPAMAYLIIVAYVALINVLGFYAATMLFLACYMRFMNIKSLKVIFLTEAILLGFVFLLFNVGLRVRFPQGLLI